MQEPRDWGIFPIARGIYYNMSLTRQHSGITIKSKKELELMRRAGAVVAQAKVLIGDAVRPGITTGELDKIAEDEIRRAGATPSFKGYMGVGTTPFSGTICTSIKPLDRGVPTTLELPVSWGPERRQRVTMLFPPCRGWHAVFSVPLDTHCSGEPVPVGDRERFDFG